MRATNPEFAVFAVFFDGRSSFANKVNISKTDTVDKDADYRRLRLDLGFKF
jgi:hypothetical protein